MNERGGRTARKHDAFADTVGWWMHDEEKKLTRFAQKIPSGYVMGVEWSTFCMGLCAAEWRSHARHAGDFVEWLRSQRQHFYEKPANNERLGQGAVTRKSCKLADQYVLPWAHGEDIVVLFYFVPRITILREQNNMSFPRNNISFPRGSYFVPSK